MTVAASLASPVVSAPAGASAATTTSSTSSATLASNFQTFLTLLTTQLQNQSPLDPLDTNQFTQQLVQFAQVEQQLKQNDQLASLIALQKTAQATQALNFVGYLAVVDGNTAKLSNGEAMWSLTSPKPVTATINIRSESGLTVFTGNYTVDAGPNTFVWDGRSIDGAQLPEGNYTISVTAADSTGQTVAVSTETQGYVDSADFTQAPPVLSIGGRTFTLDQIKRVVRPGA